MQELEHQRVTSDLQLRFEDVAQDGRMRVDALPVALGAVWRAIKMPRALRRSLVEQGVLPILTRIRAEALEGPFAIDHSLSVVGGFALHAVHDAEGRVERLLLDMDAEVSGPKGRTHLPAPSDAGSIAVAGRMFAEHVFTRPFADAKDRKVLALDVDGSPFVPKATRAWQPALTALEVPEGARAIEDDFVTDATPLAMGLAHTDSNQHVNSLVYPRLFEDAILRRLATLGRGRSVLSREMDLAFRRPTFAGETLRVRLRLYEHGKATIATGSFFGEGEDDLRKARVYVRMTLD